MFDARWRLRAANGNDAGALSCRSVIQTPAGATVEELVIAHQQNLKRFTELVSQAATSGATRCPSIR
ncbi:hypothetical protein D3C78_1857050 [compost metagenome]